MSRRNLSVLKVRFIDFWPGAKNSIESFFLPLVQSASPLEVVESQLEETAHITISSVFPSETHGSKRLLRSRRLNREKSPIEIWYSGENIRSPFTGYDFTWSFDLSAYRSSNFYLPVWFLDLDVFNKTTNPNLGFSLHSEDLMNSRTISEIPPGFACIIANNPHPYRLRAIEALSSIGAIDVFGHLGNRTLKHKSEIRNKYRYCISFENDFFPGYVTEKVFHAWSLGSIPIYWGSDPVNFINEEAVVDLSSQADFNGLCDKIRFIEADVNRWATIASKPILLKPPSLFEIIENLKTRISQVFLESS